jgi:hypothetical protein
MIQPKYLDGDLLLYNFVHRKTHMDPGFGIEKLAFNHLRSGTASKRVSPPIR